MVEPNPSVWEIIFNLYYIMSRNKTPMINHPPLEKILGFLLISMGNLETYDFKKDGLVTPPFLCRVGLFDRGILFRDIRFFVNMFNDRTFNLWLKYKKFVSN